ncbi:MAG: MBOAT family O-acyltransferase, partial [Gemmiger sp.]
PYFLLAASYAYYCYEPANRALLPVLLGTTLVTWGCGLVIGKCKMPAIRVVFLLAAVFSGVGILVYYKYWNLLADSLAGFGMQRRDLITPLGLSYFTFAALSYSIDVFRRRCKAEPNLLHYALFVSFFPAMVTGPIGRYPQMQPQIQKPRRFSYNRCAGGAFRMLWGYTKKMVLADTLNLYVSAVYKDAPSMAGPHLVAATLLFSILLYMDFSGCCDIALGAARILGYDLIENFRSPFASASFSEFWRRWHISMNSWFRDYVYIPLGGSRCAPWRRYLNILVVFLCSGLWHGADWRYLMWGLVCGLFSVFGALTRRPRAVIEHYNPFHIPRWLQMLGKRVFVFLLFSFTMVFFAGAYYNADPFVVFSGMSHGWQSLQGALAQVASLLHDSGIDGRRPAVLLCGLAIVFAAESNGANVADWIRRQCFVLRWTLYYGAAAAILFFAAFGQSAFIYQTF